MNLLFCPNLQISLEKLTFIEFMLLIQKEIVDKSISFLGTFFKFLERPSSLF